MWDGDKLKMNKSIVQMYDKRGRLIFPKSQCPGRKCNCSSRNVSTSYLT